MNNLPRQSFSGRCFLVHKKNEFVSGILASWFRQSKFASFQRQLNLYGFKRITTGKFTFCVAHFATVIVMGRDIIYI